MNLEEELIGTFLMLSPTVRELISNELERFLEDAKEDKEPLQIARAMQAIIALSKAKAEEEALNDKVT
jgi:hypothetical protein